MIKATDRKLVGLEIGTAKVSALVGEILPDGGERLSVRATAVTRNGQGGVNDLESVVNAFSVPSTSGTDGGLPDFISLSGVIRQTHQLPEWEIGMVPISEEEVTREDVENVVHTAKSVRVRDEHRVLHVIPQEYAIDYQEGIKNPVGLSGVRMQAKCI